MCCADGENCDTVSREVSRASKRDKNTAVGDVCRVVRSAAGVFTRGNFRTTLDMGGIFRKSRRIALRMSFKSPKISTGECELHITAINKGTANGGILR